MRAMAFTDCGRVSEIRVRGWQTAYRGLVPQSYLDGLSEKEDAERRRGRFGQGDGSVVNLVAEEADEIVGWAAHGPYRDGDVRAADAELYALYVDVDRLGGGLGRRLLTESVRQCAALGHERMYLWVLRDNARARRFYERAGFSADGAEEPFEVDGALVPEVRYVKRLAD